MNDTSARSSCRSRSGNRKPLRIREPHRRIAAFKSTRATLGIAALCLFLAADVRAQRQMEKLGRGVVAVRTNSTSVYIGWRLLATDPNDIGFNLYRVTGASTNQLNGAPLTASCNFVDSSANLNVANSWFVRPVVNAVEQNASTPFTLPAGAAVQQYLSIPLTPPVGGTTPIGENYTYVANDCSAADLDGDGEFEIVLKWDPSNAKDNSQTNYTGNVFLDAYKLNGTRLWRIDLGRNIRAGAHYTQFMVYDLDGDGRAELACKTAPGTKDGLGNDVIMPGDDPNAVYVNSEGYILSGPEYFTIFDGLSGGNLWTTNYVVPRDNVCDWGDCYGNRVDRFLACVAYLDGVRPSVVMCRGYYTRAALVAWDWRNGQLTQRWVFDTGFSGGPWSDYKGQGNHNLSVGDVDGDGKDEIIYGACSIDDDGTGIYSTDLGHGDALHVSDLDPDRPGLEVWDIHEPSGVPGADFRDARTGEAIFTTAINAGEGPGRCVAANVFAGNRGCEMWGAGGLLDRNGVNLGRVPGSVNFLVWWDADPIRELLDGNHIDKYGTSSDTRLLTASGASSNNGTKSTPGLSADLFGDWREEVIWRASDNSALRIYTTTLVATNRFYTLMHDPQYRAAIAWQNVAYNQPPHPGFYLGTDMYPQPVSPMSDANLVWRGGGTNGWDLATSANWFTNRPWMSNYTAAVFHSGDTVLFDLSGSNNTPVNLAGALAPAKVTVHAPKDYVFGGAGSLTGAMSLVKAGTGRLTINTTNSYTGPTVVTEGTLTVNGTLDRSAVTVQGSVWGTRLGGSGRLGQGATLLRGAILAPGSSNGIAGTLIVSNNLVQTGNVLDQFDLSNDPSGVTKTNDRVNVFGNLTLGGTNTIQINQPDGFLGGGVYPLFTYTGTLSGGLSNFVLSGTFIQSVALTNPPGVIALAAFIPPAPPPAPGGLLATAAGAFQINLKWTDNSTDENLFLIERSTGNTNNFAQIASVSFNVTNYSDLGLEPTTTYFYRVRGTNLAGAGPFSNVASATTTPLPPLLTWRGDGTTNLWDIATTPNWFTGSGFSVFDNGVDVVFDQTGSNSPAISLVGALQPDSMTVNATKSYTLGGSGTLGGAMALLKSGSGGLSLNTSNSFSGGITLNAGTITLGNIFGAGAGPIRFNGGTVTFAVGNQQTYANALSVLTTGTIVSAGGNNNIVSGAWSGSNTNTLNLSMASGTFTLGGNMTGFSGTLALGNSAGFLRFNGSSGSANTTFDLGTGTTTLNNRNGDVITLGALTGGSGTFLSGAGAVDAPSTYIVGGKNLNTTFAGTIRDASAPRTTTLIKVGSGVWTLTGNNTYSGTTTVSDGTLLVNGNQSAATNTITVASGATLGGSGIIGGHTTVFGSLAPGNSIGTLTFNGDLTFAPGSTAHFEVSLAPLANDVVSALGTITFTGTLSVENISVEVFQAGDNFQLFDAADYSGSFENLNAPSLDEGLVWSTSRLTVDGTIWVVKSTAPTISSATRSGGDFNSSGTGGTPNWYYCVLTSTNLALPLNQWSRVQTNQFDSIGGFTFTDTLDPGTPQRFYLIQAE